MAGLCPIGSDWEEICAISGGKRAGIAYVREWDGCVGLRNASGRDRL